MRQTLLDYIDRDFKTLKKSTNGRVRLQNKFLKDYYHQEYSLVGKTSKKATMKVLKSLILLEVSAVDAVIAVIVILNE